MLERATICPQHGARHVQALSTRLTHSRRHLHNSFWLHGAGDINLPFWWIEFLRKPPCERPSFVWEIARTARSYIPTILRSSFLINFLYPHTTLSLATRILNRTLVPLGQFSNLWSIGHASRHYSSPAMQHAVQEAEHDGATEGEFSQEMEMAAIRDLTMEPSAPEGPKSAEQYEEDKDLNEAVKKALIQYGMIEDTSALPTFVQSRTPSVKFQELAQNLIWYRRIWQKLEETPGYHADFQDEAFDAEQRRTIGTQMRMVFYSATKLASLYVGYCRDALPLESNDWSSQNFVCMIQASYILRSKTGDVRRLGDLGFGRPAVLQLLKRAIDHGEGVAAIAAIMDLTLSFRDWSLGSLAFYYVSRQGSRPYIKTALSNYDLHFLGQSILSIAWTFRQSAKPYSLRARNRVRQGLEVGPNYFPEIDGNLLVPFMLYMIEWFFQQPLSIDSDPLIASQVWDVLLKIQDPPEHSLYRLAIRQLLSPEGKASDAAYFTVQALKLWDQTRFMEGFAHHYNTLEKLFFRLAEIRHAASKSVFEYLQANFGVLHWPIYRTMFRELSHNGETEKFVDMLKKIGSVQRNTNLEPLMALLIAAYGRRSDVLSAQEAFDSISEQYEIQPGIECWTALIGAYLRASNFQGAMICYSKMQEEGVSPSLGLNKMILNAHCRRGEAAVAGDFIQELIEQGHELDMSMVNLLITAHVNNNDVEEAERTLLDTIERDIPGNKTEAWNSVLYAYAIQGDMRDVQFLHGRMAEAGVREDEMTYAALIQGFVASKLPGLGMRVIRRIMPRKRLVPKALHFNIVILGYLRTRQYSFAFKALERMRSLKVRPDFSTKTLLVRTAVAQSIHDSRDEMHRPQIEKVGLDSAEKLLDYLLQDESPADIAPHHYQLGSRQQPLHDVYAANYFDSLIFVYGEQHTLDKVSELFDRYLKLTKTRFPHNPVSPPMRMLAALMLTHRLQGNHDDVKQCWTTAWQKAQTLAARTGADPTAADASDWVLPNRRFLLHLPLYHYMLSLLAQGLIDDAAALIDQVTAAGFRLDAKAWNGYLQHLCLAGRPERAFELCEQHLIDGFPGWPTYAAHKPAHMLFKHSVGWKQDLRRMGPTYRTMVVLAAGYMDIRSKYALMGRELNEKLSWLSEVAPDTVHAVVHMPRVNDEEQLRYLRGR